MNNNESDSVTNYEYQRNVERGTFYKNKIHGLCM